VEEKSMVAWGRELCSKWKLAAALLALAVEVGMEVWAWCRGGFGEERDERIRKKKESWANEWRRLIGRGVMIWWWA
jgi:hypothetical protein